MDESRILDGLFALIGLLFLPIGFRRGASREVFTSAGVLGGAALASAWAVRWGGELADVAGFRVSHSRFFVTIGLLALSVLVIGYLAPRAAGLGRPTLRGRLAGGLVATMNGALLLAFVLEAVERDLASGSARQTLQESLIADALLRDLERVLLGFGGIALALTLGGLLLARRDPDVVAAPAAPAVAVPPSSGKKPRLRGGRDDGKVEPAARAFDPVSERFAGDAPHFAQTMPIAPMPRQAWPADRPAGAAVSPANRDEWVELARHPSWPAPGEPRCPGCGEQWVAGDLFCPRCGRGR